MQITNFCTSNNDLKGIKLKFFEKLPQQFDRQGYLKVAEELGILPRTAEKYVGQFKPKLLNHEHNLYTKVEKRVGRFAIDLLKFYRDCKSRDPRFP